MGFTVKSDRVGRKKKIRPETPQVSALFTSKQMNQSKALSNTYSMMKSERKSSLKTNQKPKVQTKAPQAQVVSIYDSQLSNSYEAPPDKASSESIPKNESSSVLSNSPKKVSTSTQLLGLPQPQISRSSPSKLQGLHISQKVPKSTKGPLSLQKRVQAGRAREKYQGENEISDMKYLVEEGPLSFRAIAFLGGFFMILASVLDLIDQDEADLTAMGELITVFLWFFGIIIMTLEGRPFNIQIPFLYTSLITFCACFRFVWGRGFLYFVGGCLQFFLFTKYDMISGIFFMILGIISIISGYKASVKLAGLRNSISSRSDIKYLFHTFDKDRDGFLNIEEFRDMMVTMDQNVDYNEFVAALSAIDMHNNQRISIQDMEQWYLEYSEDELPPGMGCCSTTRYDVKAGSNSNGDYQAKFPNAHLLA